MEETMKKRDLAAIDAEIAQTKEALNNVHGSETEVYARIVGYYRAVRNWNKGKRDEFNHRKMFTLEDSKEYTISAADSGCGCSTIEQIAKPVEVKASVSVPAEQGKAVSYEFYARRTCPNCPPVKSYMAGVSLSGTIIDVDTKEGLSQAALKGVFAAPTVIFYDASGAEIARGHNVDELSAIVEPAVATAAV